MSSAAPSTADAYPRKPFTYLSPLTSTASSSTYVDLTSLDLKISQSEEQRQKAYDLGCKLKVALVQSRSILDRPHEPHEIKASDDNLNRLVNLVLNFSNRKSDKEVPNSSSIRSARNATRESNLSFHLSEYARHISFTHFLENSTLPPQSSLPSLTDEEYLGGAIISVTQDLARYAIGRATLGDIRSVQMSRDVVADVLEFLLKFDFRNGVLRRRYDGVKYANKTLETILYELVVTNAADKADICSDNNSTDTHDKISIARKKELLPIEELEALRKRMEYRDELREKIIKRCRDAQKAAKQAIFALHRNDIKRADALIRTCEDVVEKDLLPIVLEEPGLRYGCFSGVMEEYAEAQLFRVWLMGDDSTNEDSEKIEDEKSNYKGTQKLQEIPSRVILCQSDFKLTLSTEEYLGGLCDLTGEIGRYAVQRGTQRDSNGVKLCLETNLNILNALETLQRFPSGGGMGKKMEPLRRSVEKLERMLYELSLVEATGRNFVADSMKDNHTSGDGIKGGDHCH